VDEGERLSIMHPDTDLEPSVATDRVTDDAAHLQPAHLTRYHPMLDDGRGSASLDHGHEGEVGRSREGRRGQRRALRQLERAAVDVPHRDWNGERRRPPGEQPGLAFGEEVECVGVPAPGPRQRGSETTCRIAVDEHPRNMIVDQRGRAGREARRLACDLAAEVLADQCAQLDAAEPAATLGRGGVDRGYLLPDRRVP
jgi:hypothetical protein